MNILVANVCSYTKKRMLLEVCFLFYFFLFNLFLSLSLSLSRVLTHIHTHTTAAVLKKINTFLALCIPLDHSTMAIISSELFQVDI